MRSISLLLAAASLLGAVLAACGGSSEPESESSAPEDRGDLVLTFEEPAPEDSTTAELVESSGVVEEAIEGINGAYALPEDIGVVFAAADEEEIGPYFDPEGPSITMPYAYLTADRELFAGFGYEPDEVDDAVIADLLFTLYHEIGHALVSALEVPVTGREEDAVDALAAVLLTETYEDGQDIVLTAADWFAAVSDATSEVDYNFSDFADEHSLDDQRYVTLMCLVYGSDPEGQADLVDPEVLPEERADGCEAEYEQAAASWSELLAPYEL